MCITGVSRYGKAALVATAFDTRIAAGFVASSGAGGAKLFRRDFGELLENLAGRGEYHWMAGNFLKYGGRRGQRSARKRSPTYPSINIELIAPVRPRLCFISYGIPDKGIRTGSMPTAASWPACWRVRPIGCSARRISAPPAIT